MSFKGGIYFLDLRGVTAGTGTKVTISGIYDDIMRIKGKPIYVYAYTGYEYGEGFANVVWHTDIELNVSFYDTTNEVLVNINYAVDDDDGVTPVVSTYAQPEE